MSDQAPATEGLRALLDSVHPWRIALESIARHSGDPGSRFVAAQALDATTPPRSFDETDGMCPNCVTPWKCNGPHLRATA